MTDEIRPNEAQPEEARATRQSLTRRQLLGRIAQGAVYSSPVIRTLVAPDPAAAQTVSAPGMMMTFCDFFPILCRIFGGRQNTTGTNVDQLPASSMGVPGSGGISRPAPWDRSSPGTSGTRPGGSPPGGLDGSR